MSHFYGVIQSGNSKNNEVTKRGFSTTGLKVTAASWEGAIEVELQHDEKEGDIAIIKRIPWKGEGENETLFVGNIGKRKFM